ncbi:trehalose-phosphatase [Roseisalinus antarcticus]|uniref:Trehalose 6-phosphate phosphatase n=1 Tax=Roseisalinus antarcticus TaxID=254357 RepID=A0A1Y5SFL2_9RHOB|nr:trehalose-phosphatase [Roseisalinus antarcticus]SLN39291.1 Trehalose-6-phosphate phosphatase [Roseisalinus antarcticus]
MYYEMIGFMAEPHGDGPCEVELPQIDLANSALFLDFDGTLVDIADTPDSVSVPSDLPDLLKTLNEATGGKLVIVTGRPVADVSRFLGGFEGHVIGCHGAEDRVDGEVRRHPLAYSDVVKRLGDMVEAFAATHDGLLAERKPTGVVIHFRQVPEQEPDAYTFLHALEQSHEGFDLHHSKMAYELRPAGISKDASIQRVMESEGFAGRRPIFFGDDVTDEPALAWVSARTDGIAVKVGTGDTSAGFRVHDTASARQALKIWAGLGS